MGGEREKLTLYSFVSLRALKLATVVSCYARTQVLLLRAYWRSLDLFNVGLCVINPPIRQTFLDVGFQGRP